MLWYNYIESGEIIYKVVSFWVKFKFFYGFRLLILFCFYEDDN